MARALVFPLLMILAATLLAGCAASQQVPLVERTAAGWLAQGDSLMAVGQWEEAEAAFGQARDGGAGVGAALGLGRAAAQQQDWSRAIDHFGTAHRLAPDSLEARYYLGLAHRELGRFRVPLRLAQELLEWQTAQAHFEAVLARDSSFKDVLFQYALLENYRGRFEDAIALGHRQVRLRPTLPEGHVGLFRLYDLFLFKKEKAAAAWLAGQASPHAAFFRAELLRRQGRLDAAETALQDLLDAPSSMPRAPVHLALARLYAAQERPEAVEAQFGQAVEGIDSGVEAALLFEDVKYVLDDAEVHAFRRLTTGEDYQDFFRGVWARRDPLPAAKGNARLVEHFARLVYAEEHFAWYGLRSWHNNPDKLQQLDFAEVYRLNERFNDRGLIYLRHGPPDDRTTSLGAALLPNESWRYFATESSPALTLHFIDLAGANWRLVPILHDPAMLEDRVLWGTLYHQLFQAHQQNRRLEVPLLELEMLQASQEAVDAALATDRPTWPVRTEALEMHALPVAFRGVDGLTEVDVFFAIPMKAVVAAVPDSVARLAVEMGLAVHDLGWRRVEHRLETQTLRLSDDPTAAISHAYRFTLAPDSYHVAVHFRPEATDLLAGLRLDARCPDFSGPALALSDLVPAHRIAPSAQPGPFVRKGLRIQPNPTRRFSRSRPVFVYFEVYHLTLGRDDRTDYTLEYTLTPLGRRGLFGRRSRPALSFTTEAQGTEVSPVEHPGIDVSAVEAGSYTLTITVTDQHTGRSAARSQQLALY